jgi:TonB family protein
MQEGRPCPSQAENRTRSSRKFVEFPYRKQEVEMRFQLWLSSSLLVGSCLIGAPSQAQDTARTQDQNQATMRELFGEPEYFLRKHLITSPKPEYPPGAQEAGIQGEVVAFVWFDKDGKLVEAKPLVSPDESLSKAVVSALKEWRVKFYMPYNPEANHWSELRFIFTLKDGEALVSDAPEAEQRTVSRGLIREISRRRKQTY